MSKHSNEPWAFSLTSPAFDAITDADGNWLLEYTTDDDGIHFKPEDMRRIAACVNACSGIATEDLERYYNAGGGIDEAMEEAGLRSHMAVIAERDELLAALRAIHSAAGKIQWEDPAHDGMYLAFHAAGDAIAKAGGAA